MNPLEIIGFLFGIAGVWLTIKEHWWCFPVGLVNVTVSLFLFFDQRLYSDAVQQAVYILLLSYGWYQWKYNTLVKRPEIGFMNGVMKVSMLIFLITLSFSMGYLFDKYTDADVPYLDSSATALSFIAQFLIARKKMENWLIWMVVNVMYIGIYSYKELYLYVLLFAVYLALSVKGYISWKALMNKQKQTEAYV